jgi:hypothetical protein
MHRSTHDVFFGGYPPFMRIMGADASWGRISEVMGDGKMADSRQTDEHAQEIDNTGAKFRRRGVIAGAAALVVALTARSAQSVGATTQFTNNGYTASDGFDPNPDGVQG